MHWLDYYDAVSWLNEAKTQVFQPADNFENLNLPVFRLPACLPACRKFHMIKVIAADLRKCCSEDDLPTAP